MKFYSKIFVNLRNNFFKGILISVPVFITFYVAWILIKFFDNKVTPVLGPLIPKHLNPSNYLPFEIPGQEAISWIVGFILTFLFVLITGYIISSVFGKILVCDDF